LPRLAGPEVLVQAIRDGAALLTWQSDTFAYAEARDDAADRYQGLRGGQHITVSAESSGLLVRPDVARRQLDAEVPEPPRGTGGIAGGAVVVGGGGVGPAANDGSSGEGDD